MDKEDLFDVNQTLKPPEEELKETNQKKKMKIEVYVSNGFYEQLGGYMESKKKLIMNNIFIPDSLKEQSLRQILESAKANVFQGYELHELQMDKQHIDQLIDDFNIRKNNNLQPQYSENDIKEEQIQQRKLYNFTINQRNQKKFKFNYDKLFDLSYYNQNYFIKKSNIQDFLIHLF